MDLIRGEDDLQKHLQDFSKRLALLVELKAGGVRAKFQTLADVNERNLRRWLNRESVPRLDSILRIAQVCQVSPNWLLFGIGPMELDLVERLRDSPLARVWFRIFTVWRNNRPEPLGFETNTHSMPIGSVKREYPLKPKWDRSFSKFLVGLLRSQCKQLLDHSAIAVV